MATEEDLDLDIAIELELAKAKAKTQAYQSAPQPEREPDYWGSAWEGVVDNVRAPIEMAKGAYNWANDALSQHPGQNPLLSLGYEAGEYGFENPESVAPNVATGLTLATAYANPYAGVAAAPTYSYLANRANEWMGLAEPQSGTEQTEQAIRQTVGGVAGVGAAKAANLGSKLATKAINYFDNKPWDQRITWEQAQREGVTATPLNSPKGTTLQEQQIAKDIAQKRTADLIPYEEQFLRENPMEGLRPQPGVSGLKATQDVLRAKGARAMEIKQQVLDLVDQRGPGITLDEVDFSPLDKYDPDLFSENAPFAKKAIADAFSNKPMSANETQGLIRKIDREITKLGGYDDLYVSSGEFNPSKTAQRQEHLGALRAARGVLNDELNKYAGRVLGVENPLAHQNAVASTAFEYDPIFERGRFDRLQGETMEFAPGRSLTGANSSSGSLLSPLKIAGDEISGGWLRNRGIQRARQLNLDADDLAVKRLQDFQRYRGQPMGPVERRPGFKWINAKSEAFQAITDALSQVIPGFMSLDPMTGQIHDPNERRVGVTAVQNAQVSLVQQAQAISQLNAGKLPQGIEQVQQTQELPSIDTAYGAAENAMGGEHELGSELQYGTEDERAMLMMDEVDVDRSGY
jgi:hypothetical protein